MSDRINAITVVLDRDTREDDIKPLIDAVLMLKGVRSVNTHIVDIGDHVAYERAKHDIEQRLWKALRADEPQ